MAFSIKDPETDRLARQLARLTAESISDSVKQALRDRVEHERRRRGKHIDRAKIAEIVGGIATCPRSMTGRLTSSSATMT
jgi:antitoxin VapB